MKEHAWKLGIHRSNWHPKKRPSLLTRKEVALAANKALWMKNVHVLPGATRTQLQNACKGPYNFLRSQASEWLEGHLPRRVATDEFKRKVDWEEREAALREGLRVALAELRAAEGRPQRISRRSIHLALRRNLQPKALSKMPKLAKEIDFAVDNLGKICETSLGMGIESLLRKQ